MAAVTPLSFAAARECVLQQVRLSRLGRVESVPLPQAGGRVLAADVRSDRAYPPAPRSVRDGFAVRSADLPGTFRVIGEVRAGEAAMQQVGPGQAVEIMTGGLVPSGADQIVMVEHVTREGSSIRTERPPEPAEFINAAGVESAADAVVLAAGTRVGYPQVALLATVGCVSVPVFALPRVAILPTGDEVIPPEQVPLPHQVRNSNGYSLAVQVEAAGGVPHLLTVAPDDYRATRALIEEGLQDDLLLLSGGVSAGKYDLVEQVLADLGAEFFFDRVLIQPGQPLVFGRVRDRFFFGLPGNPVSTMVTFQVSARAALELLCGLATPTLPLAFARLTQEFRHRAGLTRFLPAWLDDQGGITPVVWAGSGDVFALARANAFLVAAPERPEYRAGDMIGVLSI